MSKRIKNEKLRNEFYCNGIDAKNRVVCIKRLPEVKYRNREKDFVLYYSNAQGKRTKMEGKGLQVFYDIASFNDGLAFVLTRFYFKEGTLEKAKTKAKGILRRKHSADKAIAVSAQKEKRGVKLEPKFKGMWGYAKKDTEEMLTRAKHNREVWKRKGMLDDYLDEDRTVWRLTGHHRYDYEKERKEQAIKEFELALSEKKM